MKQSERGQERDDRHRAYIVSLSGVVFINFELRKEHSVWSYEYFRVLMASCSVMAFSCIFYDHPHRQRLHLHRCTFTCYKHSALTFFISYTRS